MHSLRPVLLLALTVAVPATAGVIAAEPQQRTGGPKPPPVSRTVTEVTIQQRLILRIPRLPVSRVAAASAPVAPLPPIRWVERKTDKCVGVEQLAAATIAGVDSVDLVLSGGKRIRARLDDNCPALGFYSGLYLRMNADRKLCAARDSIRSRSGGECRIASFKALVPSR